MGSAAVLKRGVLLLIAVVDWFYRLGRGTGWKTRVFKRV